MTVNQSLETYIEQSRTQFENLLGQMVEIPSISLDPDKAQDVRRMATMARQVLTDVGAEAQIVSRSTDWVEIVDPASKKTGWIHQSFVAPQAEPSSRPVPPEEMASLAETEEDAGAADDDQQPSLRSKSRKHASRHRHRHTLVLGPFILRFR